MFFLVFWRFLLCSYNIEKDINVLNDNSRVVTIYGKVNNKSDVKQKIPRLRASLLDSTNNILSSCI